MNTDEKIGTGFDQTNDEITIDLKAVFQAIYQKIWLIIACAVIGGVLAGIFTAAFVTPTYSASSMIYIYSKTTSITSLADLQIGSQLAVDFQIVARTREVMEKVIEKLDLNTSYEELLGQVNIYSPTGSHILRIDVTHSDPYAAADISNAVADELRERIADVMNTDMPSVVERAVVPQWQSSPNLTGNVITATLAAGVIAAGVIAVANLLDDTIKTDADITRYLGLNTLAMIPQDRSRKSDTTDKRKKTSRKKSKR